MQSSGAFTSSSAATATLFDEIYMNERDEGHLAVALINKADNYALVSDCFSRCTALVKMPTENRVGITAYRDGLARFLGQINENTRLYWGHGQKEPPHSVPGNMLHACNEVLDGKVENDVPSNSPLSKRPGAGNAKMMEHTCGNVKLVYNANTL